jgi:hypothetical protein
MKRRRKTTRGQQLFVEATAGKELKEVAAELDCSLAFVSLIRNAYKIPSSFKVRTIIAEKYGVPETSWDERAA